jgi:hypothetical protein
MGPHVAPCEAQVTGTQAPLDDDDDVLVLPEVPPAPEAPPVPDELEEALVLPELVLDAGPEPPAAVPPSGPLPHPVPNATSGPEKAKTRTRQARRIMP